MPVDRSTQSAIVRTVLWHFLDDDARWPLEGREPPSDMPRRVVHFPSETAPNTIGIACTFRSDQHSTTSDYTDTRREVQ